MKSTLKALGFTLVFPVAALAGHQNTYIFTAHLDMDQVAHELVRASNARHAPRPFYKKFCRKVHSTPYPNAGGYAVLMYTPKTNRVKFALAYHGLSGPAIMAHFHIGEEGDGGPIVQTICGHPPPGNKALGYSALPPVGSRYCPRGRSGFVTGSFKIAANSRVKPADTRRKVIRALMHSKLYINVHTCLNEPGEIRGQLTPLG